MEGIMKYTMFQAIRPHFKILVKYIFVDPIVFKSGRVKISFSNFLPMCSLIVFVIYNIQYLMQVIESRHNKIGVINSLFVFLTTLMALLKQIAFNVRLTRVKRLFDTTEGQLFSPKNSEQVKILDQNEKNMARILYYYLIAVFSSCTFYGVYPIVPWFTGQDVQLTIYFPFDVNESPVFYFAVAYLTGLILIQGYVNLLLDCIIAAFYSQTTVQLRLLRNNLENLVLPEDSQRNQYTNDRNPTYYVEDSKLQEKLVQCIEHYRLIRWFLREVESVTSESVTGQLLVTAWVICMTVYKIVSSSIYSAELMSAGVYLGCVLWQLFLYCYFGTQVHVESHFVCTSVYCCDWLAISPKIRRELLILMASASRPIIPFAAKIVPVSLQSYIAVLRASYTLFTFLNKKPSHI